MKEYKIGETFLIGRKKFQVVSGNCEECYFGNKAFENSLKFSTAEIAKKWFELLGGVSNV